MEARADGIDARGKSANARPQWIPSDPEMVTVIPDQGREVKITVRRAGQSRLKVVTPGFSRELSIKVTYQGNATQVEIF